MSNTYCGNNATIHTNKGQPRQNIIPLTEIKDATKNLQKGGTMKVATFDSKLEIFHTLQGEGRNSGMPAIFLRLSNCNLFCRFCDAYYTFNWEGTKWEQDFPKVKKGDHQVNMMSEDIMIEFKKYDCKNIVLTGGEPLLQQKELVKLLKGLKEEQYHVEIETNGTMVPTEEFFELIDQINCSPKLENSNNPKSLREREKALTALSASPKTDFKFVIANSKDLEEVLYLIEKYKMKNIWLMPMGIDSETLNKTAKWLAEVCKEKGFRLTGRMQIDLYGNKPGT